MATVNIIPIMDHHDANQPVIVHPIGDSDALKQSTLLPNGVPIETLSDQETWTDPKTGEKWVLPKSKNFQDFIKTKYGTPEYMSNKENFLHQIIASLQSNAPESDSPPFPYQKFVRDYLRLGTPYRGLLLEHGLGSGKTRSTIMVAKTFRKAGLTTLILTPAFLHLNFMDELKKWEDPDVNINAHYKFVHYNATGYSPKTKSASGEDIGGKGGVFDQLAALGIGFSKTDEKYGDIFPYLRKKYKRDLKPPEHMLIIIEEAHNLNRSFINHGASKVKSLLYPLLMKARDCKFICLSGTPVVSSPFEMVPMYNLLRGPMNNDFTAFPHDENAFNGYFVDYITRSFTHVDIMMSRMVGLGSYFVGITDDKDRVIFPGRKDHVIELKASTYQTWLHDQLLDEELGAMKKKKKHKLMALPGGPTTTATMSDAQSELTPQGTYHTRSRAACNFVFPMYIKRPSNKEKDMELLERYIFKFQRFDTKKPAKTIDDYQNVWNMLLTRIDLEDEDEEIKNEFEELKAEGDITKIREFISGKFFGFFSDYIRENNGIPLSEPFIKCLTKSDIEMITKTAGKYQDRLRLALNELAIAPPGQPSAFSMTALKHYSAKMYQIYKIIASDIEAGAPHVVDASEHPDVSDEPDIKLPKEHEAKYESDEQVPDEDDEAEINQTLITKVKQIVDKNDPYNEKQFADVFSTDDELKKRGKKVVGGPALVYSYFSSAEGAAIFSLILQAHGFENFNSSTQSPKELIRKKRFAFFRGGMDQAVKKNIIRVFNSKENVNGQLIRVIFVTQAAAEGISLYNLRQIHIMEPHWDNVMIEQVIGRGFRLLAHRHIKNPAEREINVFRYFLIRPDHHVLNAFAEKQLNVSNYYDKLININPGAKMADHMIQTIADEKDKFRLKLNDIRIKVAVDCYLSAEYNDPKNGCFSHHDKHGPAFGVSAQSDVKDAATKSVQTKAVDEQVGFITLKRKSKINGELTSKHYIYYSKHKPAKLKFDTNPNPNTLFEAIKLYGPIKKLPKKGEDYVIPEGIDHIGYYHVASKKFIPIGKGVEVN